MNTKFFLVGIVILGMMSCKGSSGKKVYEEGKVAIERVYKEYSESNAKKYYRMKNMEDKYEWLKEHGYKDTMLPMSGMGCCSLC